MRRIPLLLLLLNGGCLFEFIAFYEDVLAANRYACKSEEDISLLETSDDAFRKTGEPSPIVCNTEPGLAANFIRLSEEDIEEVRMTSDNCDIFVNPNYVTSTAAGEFEMSTSLQTAKIVYNDATGTNEFSGFVPGGLFADGDDWLAIHDEDGELLVEVDVPNVVPDIRGAFRLESGRNELQVPTDVEFDTGYTFGSTTVPGGEQWDFRCEFAYEDLEDRNGDVAIPMLDTPTWQELVDQGARVNSVNVAYFNEATVGGLFEDVDVTVRAGHMMNVCGPFALE